MTRDEIISMARDAGIVVTGEAVWKLCKLVAAAERDACAKLADKYAKANEENDNMAAAFIHLADAIRARGDK